MRFRISSNSIRLRSSSQKERPRKVFTLVATQEEDIISGGVHFLRDVRRPIVLPLS